MQLGGAQISTLYNSTGTVDDYPRQERCRSVVPNLFLFWGHFLLLDGIEGHKVNLFYIKFHRMIATKMNLPAYPVKMGSFAVFAHIF